MRIALGRTLRRLWDVDAGVLSSSCLAPHSRTASGRATGAATVVQPDLSSDTYRKQVIRTPHLSPLALFAGVKLTEALAHLRPSLLVRLLAGGDRYDRKLLRPLRMSGRRVVAAEAREFLCQTRFVEPGALSRVPGYPRRSHVDRRLAARKGGSASVPLRLAGHGLSPLRDLSRVAPEPPAV